jgi:ribosome-associated translation inhibitor RaiA
MPASIVYHGCPDAVRDDVREYWACKRRRLERLLRGVPADERMLRLTLRRPRGRYEAHAVLDVRGAILVASAESERLLEALDRVADRLVWEVRRHLEHRRSGARGRERRDHVAV